MPVLAKGKTRTGCLWTLCAMTGHVPGPTRRRRCSFANRQAEVMLRIASEFGFTPASRRRISAPIEEEEQDPVDLLGQSGREDVVT